MKQRNGRGKLVTTLLCCIFLAAVPTLAATSAKVNINSLDYRVFPRRTHEEAAVIEWGHSAIISALDVSVAHFGPQTSEGATFEVETMPILASPINGAMIDDDGEPQIKALENADDIEGNVVVMTNAGGLLTGVQMAQIAVKSGAAALVVVNVDEEHPDDVYRMPAEEGVERAVTTRSTKKRLFNGWFMMFNVCCNATPSGSSKVRVLFLE